MKRILLCVLLVAVMPGITQAYHGCYGVRYSPYALSYYHSGLVPCGVEYTPYAFSYHNSGLVYGYGICDYGGGYGYPGFAARRLAPHVVPHAPSPVHRWAQDTPRPTQPPVRSEPRRQDPLDVMRRHLYAKGFTSVSIDRICRVDNELVSVDVRVKDRNLLIKYWNPEEVQRLNTKEAYKQKAYAKYKQDWERFAEQYQQTGGEIYTVNASEPETIVAALDSCPKLAPGNDAASQHTLYAKN